MINNILDLIKQGTEKEKIGNLEEALNIYISALQKWDHICKYQNDERVKKVLLTRMEQLVSRAEQIKNLINNNGKGSKTISNPNLAPTSTSGLSSSSSLENISKSSQNPSNINDPLKDAIRSCILMESPNVSWDDIIGLEQAKTSLKEAVILPAKFPELFQGKLKPWKGILLYGPPGTGKTFLAKACATEMKGTFLSISSADLTSKWQGESEKLIKALFDVARERAPSIIFIDEIDSLCSSRNEQENEATRRIKTEFLVQMDGVNSNSNNSNFKPILVLGTTNIPWEIDSGIRRRFERRIYIPLPDEESRVLLIKSGLKSINHSLIDDDINYIAKMTHGYSSSDVSILIKDALFEPIRKCSESNWFKKVVIMNNNNEINCNNNADNFKIYWTPCSQPSNIDNYDKELYRKTSLYDIPNNQLLPPKLTKSDLIHVLSKTKSSITNLDIDKFTEWTNKFGLSGE
ncbi:ATPase family associated with various cellular activities (AAA) family protein [Cryptosporidium meleagridis]|uniref:ATPase family associated with various cellular activities (AAA) family protein n=1 Tax=Cryptosporidium meleagridis TaxID=93969 RepID=A0A2P4YX26_9CRYT|nr:ATPase family associated with various cellular activities (AAA) family protein [Cryptosporidium meleagridis]